MNDNFQKLRALSVREWQLLLMAMAMLPLVAMLLRLAGFNRTKAFLGNFMVTKPEYNKQQPESVQVHTIARMVSVAVRYCPWRVNCLKHSLVLWWLLARCGLKSVIRFGVKKEPENKMEAHAWVEYEGINLCDSDILQQKILTFITP